MTLVELASDTYITHRFANGLNLRNEKATLAIHGGVGMTMRVNSRRYLFKVKKPVGTEKAHQLVRCGLKQ